ncbi:MAG: hypothetical protein WBD01_01400 [Salaquimonas sp.]
MADFEGLINQALAKQNAADPQVRERVYQSSRKALVKMLEKTGNLSDDAVRLHFGKLEASISKIEAGYEPPPMPGAKSVLEPAPAAFVVPEALAPETPVAFEPIAEPVQPRVTEAIDQAPVLENPTVQEPVRQESEAEDFGAEPAVDISGAEPEKSQPASEPDIIAELEALIPKAYQPAPLFPPVTPQTDDPKAAVQTTPAVHEDVAVEPMRERQQPSAPTPPTRIEPHPFPSQSQNLSDQPRGIPPQSIEPSVSEQFTQPEPDIDKVEPYLGDIAAEQPQEIHQAETVDDFSANRDEVRVYKRKNPLLRRIWPILLALAVVLVILWILYALFTQMPSTGTAGNNEITPGAVGETQQAEDGSIYITLLEPTDLSALVTAGRGSAELVNQQKRQMLRLQSVRQGGLTQSNADPILLELEKGVLKQISGKDVTVEFYAQSGQSGAAQFAIECDFAGDSICGRKRFRVGAQPERIVFALDLKNGIASDARAFLAINTDITNAADASGTGDAVDIIYVRLRLTEANSGS